MKDQTYLLENFDKRYYCYDGLKPRVDHPVPSQHRLDPLPAEVNTNTTLLGLVPYAAHCI